jgi:hypothetical protein
MLPIPVCLITPPFDRATRILGVVSAMMSPWTRKELKIPSLML